MDDDKYAIMYGQDISFQARELQTLARKLFGIAVQTITTIQILRWESLDGQVQSELGESGLELELYFACGCCNISEDDPIWKRPALLVDAFTSPLKNLSSFSTHASW